jgi:EmrB/QacA subfamily drug resistance transporter
VPVIIGGAMMMHTLNAYVIVTALPAMAVTLGEDPVRLNATISLYLLTMAIFLPVSGWAAERFGAKRVFLIAIALYALSAAACGFASNLTQLLIARAVGGATGAMIAPVGRVILLRTTPKHQLVRAMSVLSMPLLLGPALGPLLGGVITVYLDWRWIFLINIPIAALGLVLVTRYIKDVRGEGPTPVDWIGLVLTGAGMGAVVYGIDSLGHRGTPPWIGAALIGGGLAMLIVYGCYARRAPFPILDLRPFRAPTFFASTVGGNLLRGGVGATPFLLALLMQVAFGYSPIEAGLMTAATGVAALVMKTIVPPVLERFGFRTTLIVNAVIVGFSFVAITLLTESTPQWIIYAVLLTGGFFRSLQMTTVNSLAYADIESAQMSSASTISALAQRLAQSIGTAIAAALVYLLQAHNQTSELTAEAIAPVFAIIGIVSVLSALCFVTLPADAGAKLLSK